MTPVMLSDPQRPKDKAAKQEEPELTKVSTYFYRNHSPKWPFWLLYLFTNSCSVKHFPQFLPKGQCPSANLPPSIFPEGIILGLSLSLHLFSSFFWVLLAFLILSDSRTPLLFFVRKLQMYKGIIRSITFHALSFWTLEVVDAGIMHLTWES